MSGRMLSKALDIREKAEAAAALSQNLKFRCVIFAEVGKICGVKGLDVMEERTDDPAC